ncbi:MAG: DEAD/DEAH box helicase [Spirochaetales bacterium]|nr:DEAD/DEAH box helicase [Spirochaetales bacterium]
MIDNTQQKHPHYKRTVHTITPSIDTSTLKGVFTSVIPDLQKAIAAAGYIDPSPIQEQAIPHLLEGRDLMGSAQTGTGKTAAFSLPLLQKLAANSKRLERGTPRALILAPTRELTAQIGDSIKAYSRYMRISHTVIFGGVNQSRQVAALNRGIDILIATPGRLLDLMQQGFIHLEQIEVLILDEVDRMLDMGFIHDIKRILVKIPEARQTLFFSATLPPKMLTLANTMVRNPVRIDIAPEQLTVERIQQKVLFVEKSNKEALLKSIMKDERVKKVILFTQMKHVANQVVEILASTGIQCAAIHGNKSQAARVKALNGFKKGEYRVLVATDVAARGIDVDDITHVINYDLPMEAETYVHRIGRTARAGADGESISLCCAEDRAYLRAIDNFLGSSVPVETEHPFHSDNAKNSTMPPPSNFGRNAGGRGGSNRGQGHRPHPSNRRQTQSRYGR